LAGRDALSDAQRAAASEAIAARGLPLDLPQGAVVAGYRRSAARSIRCR